MSATTRNSNRTVRKSRLLGLSAAAVSQALLAQFYPSTAMASPKGGQVAHGTATIAYNGSNTIVHASNNSIINWTSFDIAKGETVDLLGPSARSRLLDRVFGNAPAQINGTLFSNCHLILIDAAGFAIGEGATINVAGITAVAGQLSDSDFLHRANNFTNLSGSISNQGTIVSTGPAALVGASVTNAGSISAGKSTVVLATGSSVYVGEKNGNVYAAVTPQSTSLASSVDGSGDLYSLALSTGSSVQGHQIVVNGGGGNVQVSGSIDASSSTRRGGSVTVVTGGANIQLASAYINASGSSGGGSIKIGGDLHGASDLPAAAQTSVSSDSTLSADATAKGNGGEVVVWSAGQTTVAGAITARGAGGGNGGLIETSGHNVDPTGATIDASSPGGKPGMWLLDPTDVTIVGAGTSTSVPVTTSGTTNTYTPGADTLGLIQVTDITNALDAGTSVDITTTSSASDPGNITVATPITAALETGASGAVSLTLAADPTTGSVFVNNAITATGNALTVVLSGGVAVDVNANISTNGGNLSIMAPTFNLANLSLAAINVGTGTTTTIININTDNFNFGTFATANSITGAGTVSITPINDTSVQFGGATASGVLTITQNDISAFTPGFAQIGVNAGSGNVTFDSGGFSYGNPLAVTTTGGITVSGTVNGTTTNSSLSLTAGTSQTIDIAQAINTDGGALSLSAGTLTVEAGVPINVAAGAINLTTDNLNFGTTASFTGTGTVTIAPLTDTAVQFGGTASAPTLLITQTTFDDFKTGFSNVTVNAGAGDVTFDAGGFFYPNPLSVITTGNITLSGAIAGGLNGTSSTALSLTAGDTSTLDIENDITTDGGNLTLRGGTIIQGAGEFISVGGGNISITTDNPMFNGGDGTFKGVGGSVTFAPISATLVMIGGAGGAGTLTLTQSDLNEFVGTQSAFQSFTVNAGANPVEFDPSGFTLGLPLAVNTTSSITVDGSISTTTSAEALTLTGGTASSITINASINTSGGTASFSAGTFTQGTGALINVGAGPLTIAADAINLGGGDGTIIGTGTATIEPLTDTNIFINQTGGGGNLGISQQDLDAFATGFSSLTINGGSDTITEFGFTYNNNPLIIKSTGVLTLDGDITANAITFDAPVSLASDTTVDGENGDVTFSGTVDAASSLGFALTISNAATATFAGVVGGQTALSTLTTTGGTLTVLGSSVTTIGAQSYGEAVSLTGTSGTQLTLTSQSAGVVFVSTVSGTNDALTINTALGTTFNDAVTLLSLDVKGSAATVFHDNATGTLALTISTSAGQTYEDAVSLTGTAVAFTDNTGTITFDDGISGTNTFLQLSGNGQKAIVGPTISVQQIQTSGNGTLTLGSNSTGITVTTGSGTQSYGEAMTLLGPTATFTSTNGKVLLGRSINGTATAVVVTGGNGVVLGSAIPSTFNVESLTAKATQSGIDLFGVNITTSGAQNYQAVVDVVNTSKLASTGSSITFTSAITGPSVGLSVSGETGNIFMQSVNVGSLTTGGAGVTMPEGGVTTTFGQTYQNDVTLDNVTLSDPNLITFGGAVNGSGKVISDGSVSLDGHHNDDAGITFESNNPSDAGQFGSNFRLISGGQNLELATLIAEEPTNQPEPAGAPIAVLSVDQTDQFGLLGIPIKTDQQARQDTFGSLAQGLIINDLPTVHNPTPADEPITPARLDSHAVNRVLADTDDLWGAGGAGRTHIASLLARGIIDYRLRIQPAGGGAPAHVVASDFAAFVRSDASQGLLYGKLQIMHRLVNDIGRLGLPPGRARSADEYWTGSLTPHDAGLVDLSGQADSHWLLDVIRSLDGAPGPVASAQ